MSSRTTRLAPIVAIAALALLGSRAAAGADPSAAPSTLPAASPAAVAKTVTVNTFHFAYDPDPVTVAVGTTVTFKNSDGVAHTVTSADDKPAFDSGDMPQNATWSHIFAKAGTYKYYCQYHTYMKGTIVVK